VAETLREVLAPTRAEPGCRSVHIFRSTRDAQLFFLHSRWQNEAAFKQHLDLPHTVRFIARIEPLLDHPLDVIRTEQIG
jgi:quinol monooxygenase YgiN